MCNNIVYSVAFDHGLVCSDLIGLCITFKMYTMTKCIIQCVIICALFNLKDLVIETCIFYFTPTITILSRALKKTRLRTWNHSTM